MHRFLDTCWCALQNPDTLLKPSGLGLESLQTSTSCWIVVAWTLISKGTHTSFWMWALDRGQSTGKYPNAQKLENCVLLWLALQAQELANSLSTFWHLKFLQCQYKHALRLRQGSLLSSCLRLCYHCNIRCVSWLLPAHRLWDASSANCTSTLEPREEKNGYVRSVLFSLDGALVFSHYDDGNIRWV